MTSSSIRRKTQKPSLGNAKKNFARPFILVKSKPKSITPLRSYEITDLLDFIRA
jgi:hypothetical protein